jgi:hypothetical protein
MIRKAVVIVPSEEDYKARIEAQDKSDAKELPDNSVMEMKGIIRKKPGVFYSSRQERTLQFFSSKFFF